jgi:hypothetical protein
MLVGVNEWNLGRQGKRSLGLGYTKRMFASAYSQKAG